MNESERNNTPTPENQNPPTTETPEIETEVVAEPIAAEETTPAEPILLPETVTDTDATTAEVEPQNPRKRHFMIAAGVIVVGIFLVIFYNMEESGRLNTGVFDSVKDFQAERTTIARVNDEKISARDLNISIQQMKAGAELQGIDVSDPEIEKDIRAQAVEVLVNTELLLQEAETRGISVTDEDVQARYDSLVEEVGGIELLEERMAQFNIDESTLMRDIKNELIIKQLLDQVFTEQPVEVTEEQVVAMYESAGGAAAGLPPMEEVREQIETQLKATEEQEIITNLVELLRTNAAIEVLIET